MGKYNISQTDIELARTLKHKTQDLQKQFAGNFLVQEQTLDLIHQSVVHADFNSFSGNKLIWNAAGFVNIVSYDLKIIGKELLFAESAWSKRYFARQGALLIYETSSDLFELLGKEFRSLILKLSESTTLRDEVNQITKSLNHFNSTYQSQLKEIRNVSIAHRDKNILEQLNSIYSISWSEAISIITTFDKILNNLGQLLQKIIKKSVVEFEELKGK